MQKILNFIKSQKPTTWITFLGLYLTATGLAVLVFSFIGQKGGISLNLGGKRSKINLNLPKTEACPINGMMYTKPEKDVWSGRRPLTTMIENSIDARPQSGLASADVVYEAVAEGGITRFLSVFYCGVAGQDTKAAPVRSARVYFINLAAGYGTSPLFLHYGGANDFCQSCPGGVKTYGTIDPRVDAYALLSKLGWSNGTLGNDLDGQSNIGFPILVRDQNRLGDTPSAWEHSVIADIDEVYKEAAKRGFNYNDSSGTPWTKGFRAWKFDNGTATTSPKASDISFPFWANWPDYNVEWKYDSASNTYKRFDGGKPHTDWNFDKPQISASDVVIMFVKEVGPVDEEKHMFYDVVGTGDALIFKNGNVTAGTWKKDSQLDREVFYDKNGSEITLTRGPIWIELVPDTNQVKY